MNSQEETFDTRLRIPRIPGEKPSDAPTPRLPRDGGGGGRNGGGRPPPIYMPDFALALRFLLNQTQQEALANAFIPTATANGYHSASAFFVTSAGQTTTRMGVWLGPWLQSPSAVIFDDPKKNGLDRAIGLRPEDTWAYSRTRSRKGMEFGDNSATLQFQFDPMFRSRL